MLALYTPTGAHFVTFSVSNPHISNDKEIETVKEYFNLR